MGFPSGSMVKEPACNAGDARDMGSIPGSGRSLEEGMATHSSILAWRIPWREEAGGLHRSQSQTCLKQLSIGQHTHTYIFSVSLKFIHSFFLSYVPSSFPPSLSLSFLLVALLSFFVSS